MARRDLIDPIPICRCRVLYLGSSVPQVTKDGLQGIQEPLRELYPAEGAVSARGIDSWLSVWSNGLLLENVAENQKKVTRFFPIETLHYCAAARYVVVAGGQDSAVPRFLPLDSPFARNPNINHPPLFACIMRRTTGIKVLECHAFICKKETAANALVRSCFHAYADLMQLKRYEGGSQMGSIYGGGKQTEERAIEVDYTVDFSSTNSEILPTSSNSSPTQEHINVTTAATDDDLSIYNGDENHKVWAGPSKTDSELIYSDYGSGTLRSAKSTSSIYGTGTSSRLPRPRQMIMPSVAPPPPPSEPDKSIRKNGKKESKSKYSPRKDDDELSRYSNGIYSNNRPGSLINGNSSVSRNMNGHSPPKSKGKLPRMFSSLAERKPKGPRPMPPFIMVGGPPPPMGPPMNHPGHPIPPPGMLGPPPPPGHPGPPPGHLGPRPPPPPHMVPLHVGPPPPPHLVPVRGPPHMMPPPPPGPMSQIGPYGPMPPMPPGGTLTRRPPSRVLEEPIYMPSARPMSPTASYQPGHFPHEQYLLQQYATSGAPRHKKKKKKSHKNQDDEDIYGRKGHINERAFSYSIREEHRSRSYGSLAGLGETSVSKKDKEIMQMVADLDLSGDEIERVEPRPGVYRPPHSDRLSVSGTISSRLSRR